MKTLALYAGFRTENGSDDFMAYMGCTKLDPEYFFLEDLTINGCERCARCSDSHICEIEDDMGILYEKMEEAEQIVFGDTLNLGDFSPVMKRFMERCSPFRYRGLEGRKALLFVIGKQRREVIERVRDDFDKYCDDMGFEMVNIVAEVTD